MINFLLRKTGLLHRLLILLAIAPSSSSGERLHVFRDEYGCRVEQEICGDGIDQDCDGNDSLCPLPDQDRDGYDSWQDCSDVDRNVYPGVFVPCQTTSGSGTRLCQVDGRYSSCTTVPLCEAKGSGKCYYISASTGADTNEGSFTKPWKSYRNITSYYRQQDVPASHQPLIAGSVVYFFSGVYRDTYPFENDYSAFQLRNLDASGGSPVVIKAYPGHNVTFAPDRRAINLRIFNSKNILIEGIELAYGYRSGLRIEDSDRIEIRNSWIHDTDGVDNNNIAGIYSVRSTNINIHHNLIHDNYDRECADTNGHKTENSRNIVLFEGGNIRVNHNIIFQTPPIHVAKTGACLVYKHGQTLVGGFFEVGHNVFKNCYFTAIGTATYGGHIHHNLIVDSDNSVSIRNHGVPTGLIGNLVEFNTMVNSIGLEFSPSQAKEGGSSFGLTRFRNNIVIDNRRYNSDSGGILKIDPYGDNDTFASLMANKFLNSEDNCFFNSHFEPLFGLYSSNHSEATAEGGLYRFSDWQSYGFDVRSSVIDPRLDHTMLPSTDVCKDKGHFAR